MSAFDQNLNDCKRRDFNAEKISKFSNTIESIGIIIMIVIFVCGIILSIVICNNLPENISAVLILMCILPWAIVGIGIYLVCKIFAYLLLGIAEIVQNTKETSNFECFGIKNSISMNAHSTNTASANTNNINSQESKRVEKIVPLEKIDDFKKTAEYINEFTVKCPYCGTLQKNDRKSCYKCMKDLILDPLGTET